MSRDRIEPCKFLHEYVRLVRNLGFNPVFDNV